MIDTINNEVVTKANSPLIKQPDKRASGEALQTHVEDLNTAAHLTIRELTKPIEGSHTQNTIRTVLGVDQDTNPEAIIRELGLPAFDISIFVMGGADKIGEDVKARIKHVLSQTLSKIAIEYKGNILVGDGGTESGIMDANGEARRLAQQASSDFPLLGVSPLEQLKDVSEHPKANSQLDNMHSHAVPVASKPEDIGEYGAWGNETKKMYELFGKLAEKKPSIGIVANGGGITVNEVIENMRQGRKLIILKGTGRAADGLSALVLKELDGLPEDSESKKRAEAFIKAAGDKLDEWKNLLTVVDVNAEDAVDQIVNQINATNNET